MSPSHENEVSPWGMPDALSVSGGSSPAALSPEELFADVHMIVRAAVGTCDPELIEMVSQLTSYFPPVDEASARLVAGLHANLGSANVQLTGDMDVAESHLQASIEAFQLSPDTSKYSALIPMGNLTALYLSQDRIEEAFCVVSRAREAMRTLETLESTHPGLSSHLARNAGDPAGSWVQLCQNVGINCVQRGDFQRATEYFSEAADTLLKQEHMDMSGPFWNTFIHQIEQAYISFGREPELQDMLQALIEERTKGTGKSACLAGNLHHARGRFLSRNGLDNDALTEFKLADECYAEGGYAQDHGRRMINLFQLGITNTALGNFIEADHQLSGSRLFYDRLSEHEGAPLYTNLNRNARGLLSLTEGHLDTAIFAFDASLAEHRRDEQERIKHPEREAEILYYQSIAKDRSGKEDESSELKSEAFKLLETRTPEDDLWSSEAVLKQLEKVAERSGYTEDAERFRELRARVLEAIQDSESLPIRLERDPNQLITYSFDDQGMLSRLRSTTR